MDKKKEQLGMNPGTAAHRLRKNLLFEYVRKCGENVCYQCGKKIENIDNFSIEHKIPWLDSKDPIGLFFDVNNIAFSHLACNSGSARRPNKKYENMYEKDRARFLRRKDDPKFVERMKKIRLRYYHANKDK